MHRQLGAVIILSGLALCQPPAIAQDLFGIMRRAVERAAKPAPAPTPTPTPTPGNRAGTAPAATGPASSAIAGGSAGPSVTSRRSTVPFSFWFAASRGTKRGDSYNCSDGVETSAFRPCNKPTITVTNPYMAADSFVFATLQGMDCAPDGSLVIGGEGWANGDVNSVGWWRIAPDGAVTPLYTSAWGETSPLPVNKASFSVAPDNSLIASSRDAIWRIRDGRTQLIAGSDAVEGYRDGAGRDALFKDPGIPVIDDAGNIWVADGNGCRLRRIAPDGMVSTMIGEDRTVCSERPVGERVVLGSLAWDPVNKELVAAGSTIVGRPVHDMHVSIWRISATGEARRVYYTVKAGRSPIGQNMDHIWAASVDATGRIIVGTLPIPYRYGRVVMRLDEKAGRLVFMSGNSFSDADLIPGREDWPIDGPSPRAMFRQTKRICHTPDRATFVLDEHLVRRFEPGGANVTSWAY